MSYTALYRKWRPKNFNDIIGQDDIVRTLKNQIISSKIVHAYLFCGTRGTGKTSTAKIFAKAVNCSNPLNGEPCNECDVCKSIIEQRNMNIVEIDAASNNGVDNIRQIKEEVSYPPTEGNYKVYIIDEVHMLSSGAFNALLKTLEEPPKHVIFILATTDPQKIPVTILSRCQRYDFKRIGVVDMSSKIDFYMSQESVQVDYEAINYISRLSDGAMRDALSILDQCIAFYYGEQITLQKVMSIVGAVDNEIFFEFTSALINKNSTQCINIIDNITVNGKDIKQFVSDMIVHFRNIIVVKSSDKKSKILDLSENNINKLSKQADSISSNEVINLIQEFSVLELQLKNSNNDKILLEVLSIKLCQNQISVYNDEMMKRILDIEESIKRGSFVTTPINLKQSQTNNKTVKKRKPYAVSEDIKSAVNIWNELKKEFKLPLSASLEDTQAGYLEGNIYYIKCLDDINKDYIESRINEIREVLEEKTGKSFNIKVILRSEFEYEYKKIYNQSGNDDFEEEDLDRLLGVFNTDGVNVEKID